MKSVRHETILSIIADENIETQEDLALRLKESGFNVTQTTVSRDIRELKLIKVLADDGRQKYAILKDMQDNGLKIIKSAVISVECGGNLIVVKTQSGMGMAVAVFIDKIESPEILGTIAGDDVVFCAIKEAEQAKKVKELLVRAVGG